MPIVTCSRERLATLVLVTVLGCLSLGTAACTGDDAGSPEQPTGSTLSRADLTSRLHELNSHLARLDRQGILVDSADIVGGTLWVHLDPQARSGSEEAIQRLLGTDGVVVKHDGHADEGQGQ
jgi:hypothetical protein